MSRSKKNKRYYPPHEIEVKPRLLANKPTRKSKYPHATDQDIQRIALEIFGSRFYRGEHATDP